MNTCIEDPQDASGLIGDEVDSLNVTFPVTLEDWWNGMGRARDLPVRGCGCYVGVGRRSRNWVQEFIGQRKCTFLFVCIFGFFFYNS